MTQPTKIARIYIRVSTDEQDTTRQHQLIADAKAQGYYVAAVYEEKASGARADRPELQRMIADLQEGDVVIAEKIDRISRLPLEQAEALVASIKAKGARLAVAGLVDLSEIAASMEGTAKIVMEAMQEMLLKLALQMAHDDYTTRRERQAQGIQLAKQRGAYKGRQADDKRRELILQLRGSGHSIAKTAELVAKAHGSCSESLVKLVCREAKGKVEQK